MRSKFERLSLTDYWLLSWCLSWVGWSGSVDSLSLSLSFIVIISLLLANRFSFVLVGLWLSLLLVSVFIVRILEHRSLLLKSWLCELEWLWHKVRHHWLESLLKWRSDLSELTWFSTELLHLLHNERVHHERVNHKLWVWHELLVSELGVLEGVEVILFNVVAYIDFLIQFLDLRIALGFFDGLFSVVLVCEVDEPKVGVDYFFSILSSVVGCSRLFDNARTDLSIYFELLLQFFLGDFWLQELSIQVGLVS